MFRKSLRFSDKIISTNTVFKWKFALIGDEYFFARKIKNQFLKIVKKRKSTLFQTYLEDAKISPKKLSSYPEYNEILQLIQEYKACQANNIPTVNVIIEGLLVSTIIKTQPFTKGLHEEFKKCVIRNYKLKDENVSQWYRVFFLETNENKENQHPISKYFLQEGKYRTVEKYTYFNVEDFELTFETACLFYSKKFPKNDLKQMKEGHKFMILLSVILKKRGLFDEWSSSVLFFNNIISVIGVKLISFVIGDSLMTNESNISSITCSLNTSEKTKSNAKTVFYSLQNQSLPNWLIFEQKKGVLIFVGEIPIFENNNEYLVRITNKKGLILFYFWILVNNEKSNKKKSSINNLEDMNESEEKKQRFTLFRKPSRDKAFKVKKEIRITKAKMQLLKKNDKTNRDSKLNIDTAEIELMDSSKKAEDFKEKKN